MRISPSSASVSLARTSRKIGSVLERVKVSSFATGGVGADEAWVRWGRYEIARANIRLGDDDIGDVGRHRRLSRRQSSMIKV